jgi:hypothetical protein
MTARTLSLFPHVLDCCRPTGHGGAHHKPYSACHFEREFEPTMPFVRILARLNARGTARVLLSSCNRMTSILSAKSYTSAKSP